MVSESKQLLLEFIQCPFVGIHIYPRMLTILHLLLHCYCSNDILLNFFATSFAIQFAFAGYD